MNQLYVFYWQVHYERQHLYDENCGLETDDCLNLDGTVHSNIQCTAQETCSNLTSPVLTCNYLRPSGSTFTFYNQDPGPGSHPCGISSVAVDEEPGDFQYTSPTDASQHYTYSYVNGSQVEQRTANTTHKLSQEFTTRELKDKTASSLPPYSGSFDCAPFPPNCGGGGPQCIPFQPGQGCIGSALADLSSNEVSYTIRRFKFRFDLSFVPIAGTVIHWMRRFTPADGGAVIDQPVWWTVPVGWAQPFTETFEQLEPRVNGTITIEDAAVVSGYDPSGARAVRDEPPPDAQCPTPLGDHEWGRNDACSVDLAISACSDGHNWHAVLTGVTGHYTKRARLLPGVQEVTGPNGNTTEGNFCDQVAQLDAHGNLQNTQWYMLGAIWAHEGIHEMHAQPSLEEIAFGSNDVLAALTVPDYGQAREIAIEEMLSSATYSTAVADASVAWDALWDLFAQKDDINTPTDHGKFTGPTWDAEEDVVRPMIEGICGWKRIQGWQQSCGICDQD